MCTYNILNKNYIILHYHRRLIETLSTLEANYIDLYHKWYHYFSSKDPTERESYTVIIFWNYSVQLWCSKFYIINFCLKTTGTSFTENCTNWINQWFMIKNCCNRAFSAKFRQIYLIRNIPRRLFNYCFYVDFYECFFKQLIINRSEFYSNVKFSRR